MKCIRCGYPVGRRADEVGDELCTPCFLFFDTIDKCVVCGAPLLEAEWWQYRKNGPTCDKCDTGE